MSDKINIEVDIGSLLLEKSLITPEQLYKATEQQKIKGGYLTQQLIGLNYIKDTDITNFLTCQYGYCYIPLNSYSISETALKTIPFQFACDYCVIAIEKNDMMLTVVIADPFNRGVIETLRQVTHCEIVVFISTRSEIKQAIEKYYCLPYKDFELDKFNNDFVLRDNLKSTSIVNGLYSGMNRRRYKRLYYPIEGEYYLYPNIIKTKVTNVSMNGVLFETNTLLPKNAQVVVNLHLDKDRYITAIVEIVRSESNNLIDAHALNNNSSTGTANNHVFYESGSFFDFMSEENQSALADFLKTKLEVR